MRLKPFKEDNVKRLLITTVLIAAGFLRAAEDNNKPERRTLVVTGTAQMTVAPDICYMSFTVETTNRKAQDAYTDNNELMNRINAAIKALGVEAKDLKTMNFSISPLYQYTDKRRIFQGYRVYNTLYVGVRDLSKVSAVIDAAIDAGATDLQGITFTIEDSKKFSDEVRRKALADARKKAEDAAQILGFRLGTPILVTESGPPSYPVYPKAMSGMMERDMMAEEAPAPSIEAGQMQIYSTVYVTYEIEPKP